MADPRLPGLNYETPITITDLLHLEQIYTQEFVERTLATVAAYRAAGASFGLLSELDPINATDQADPFYVEQNAIDGMTIDVYPGTALAENGMLIFLTGSVTSIEMVNQDVGQRNIVFVEYIVIDSEDPDLISKTRFNTTEARQLERSPDTSTDPLKLRTLQVVSQTDWEDDTLFTPDRRENIVALAVVEIISKTTTPFKEVEVDLSRTTLATNRPWFSPVDIEHRSQVGTGSSSVPHNLGLNDISQGNLTLYEQLLNYGMVLGRDQDAPGVPGSLCFETITPTRVQIDTDGSVTGQISQRYVELIRFPTRLLGAYSVPDNDNDIAVELIPHTNLLTIHQNELVPDQGIRVQYACVQAGEPLVNSLVSDEVHVEQPVADEELVISGGQGWTGIGPKFIDSFNNTRAKINIGTSAQIPKLYRILVDKAGQLLHTPQHILCSTKLSDTGTAVYPLTTPMLGAARIRAGLQNVNLSASTVVRIRISGTDNLGATVTEDVTFDISTYETPAVGQCVENDKNWQVTNTVFVSLASMTVLERTADGPSTAVCIYADLDPMQTDDLRDACPLAEAMWDGSGICRVRDIRPVYSRLEVPTRTTPVKTAGQMLSASLALDGREGVYDLLAEDVRDPHRLKLNDPLRLYKFSDGLRSTILPEQPGSELTGDGPEQDIYVSQALRLPDHGTANRRVHLTLVGREAQQVWLNGIDGIAPSVEYRVTSTAAPDTWSDWALLASLTDANGTNYQLDLDTDDYKIQFRAKASVAGIVAVQYRIFYQPFHARRFYDASIGTGETHIVALPFGRVLPHLFYGININAYLPSMSDGDPAIDVVQIDRFVDHVKVHLTSQVVTDDGIIIHYSVFAESEWMGSDGGFGDSVTP